MNLKASAKYCLIYILEKLTYFYFVCINRLQVANEGKLKEGRWMCLNTTLGETTYSLRGLRHKSKYVLRMTAINRFGHSDATQQHTFETASKFYQPVGLS